MTGPAATATTRPAPTVESDLNAVRTQARSNESAAAPSVAAIALPGGAGTQVQVLAETFSVRHDPLNEATGNCKVTALPGGRFRVRAKGQHCGVVNRNGRNYPSETTWGKHTRPDAPFMGKVKARRVIGQLEHPESGRSAMSLAAIVITEVSPPNEQGEVFIEFETMSTPGGMIVASFIRDGVGFGISSRGNGSVLRIEGVDVVQEDFDPVTFDLVVDESTPGAEVVATKIKEGMNRVAALLMESVKGDVRKAAEVSEAQTRLALARDLLSEQQPPRGDSEFLLAIDDGSAHYRAYENGVGQWDVWFEPAGLTPNRIATAMPTLKNAKLAAEEHLRLVVGNNAGKPAIAAARTMPPLTAPRVDFPTGNSPAGGTPSAGAAPKVVVNVESKKPKPTKKPRKVESRAMKKKRKAIRESFVVTDGIPFTGSMVTMEFPTAKDAEDAGDILADAGMYCFCDGQELLVYSDVSIPEQAVAAIRRVLGAEDITMAAEGRIASIRKGRVIREARYAMKVRESESGRDAPAGAGEYDGEEPKGDSEVRAPGISVSSPKKPEPWEADDKKDDKEKSEGDGDGDADDVKKKDEADKDDDDKDKKEAAADDKEKDKTEADSDDKEKDGKKEGAAVPTSGAKGDTKTWMPSNAGSVRMEGVYGEDDIEILPDDGDADDMMFPVLDPMETSRASMPEADKDDDKDKKDEKKGKREADEEPKKKDEKAKKRESDDDKKKDEKKGSKREAEKDDKDKKDEKRKAYEAAALALRQSFGLSEKDDDDKDEADDDKKDKKDEGGPGFGPAPEIEDPEDIDHDLCTVGPPDDDMPLMGGDGPEELDPAFAQPGMTSESRRRPVLDIGKPRTGRRTESRAPKTVKVETRDGRKVVKVPRRVFERLRFLEGEVARLEQDNGHLSSLVDEMENTQRTEAVKTCVESVLVKHPMLEPMKARLAKCESIDSVKEEAAGLLTMLRESQKKTVVTPLAETRGDPTTSAPTPKQASAPTAPVNRGTSVTSAKTEGAPQGLPEADASGALTKPLTESSKVDDTASRVADYRRRHRRARGQGQV